MVAEMKPVVVVGFGVGGLCCYIKDDGPDRGAYRSFTVASEDVRRAMNSDEVRKRAAWLARLIGCPMIDETQPTEPEVQKPDATEELRAAIEKLRSEVRAMHDELWNAIRCIDKKVQP